MDISASGSAVGLIQTALYKTATAAHEIATLPVQDDEVGSSEFDSRDLVKPVLSLNQAELETSAAVKILQTENDIIGSILDIKA